MSKKVKLSSDFQPTLHNYTRMGDIESVKTLVNQGVDINEKEVNFFGMLPIQIAAALGNEEILRLFIEKKGDVNLKDNLGHTALRSAVACEADLKIFKILIDAGADVNSKCNEGKTVLHVAAIRKNVATFDFFLSTYECEVNACDIFNNTPLHFACEPYLDKNYYSVKVIKLLLKNSANINAVNNNGNTPLMHMLMSNDFYPGRPKYSGENSETFLYFLLEHSETNKFDLSQFESYSNFSLWKICLEHLAKLSTLKITVSSSTIELIKNRKDFYNYYQSCLAELRLARESKFQYTWVSFFHLLTGDLKKLKNFAGNDDVIQGYKDFYSPTKYPIYGALIEKNFSKGIKRRKLFDKSVLLLSNCLPIFNLSHLIVTDIIDCIGNRYLIKYSN